MSSKASPQPSSNIHPPVGTLIDGGSLELVEVLGVGGYGVVYRAVDTRHSSGQKSYAVKCLIASGHQSPRQRQIHIREIALHQLASAHPGVVTLHRVIDQGNHTYIVMDYAPDHDLFTQILHSCRYLGNDVLIKDVFLQLLDAVEYCHSLGIFHRDLKPENILCFHDGLQIAITDFGLATTDRLSDEFRTGSVYHMSPECQGGEFAPTGNYSPMFNDIWSLGIILLNLATGRNPWKSATPGDPTFQAYLRDPMNFLPTVLPISAEINDILVRMLDVDWRERMNLHDVKYAIEQVTSFYSDGVVFEGSMARCPWESGMDIDSASSNTTPEDVGPQSPPPQSPIPNNVKDLLSSHWSKDSTSDIVFATHSWAKGSSHGAHWTTDSYYDTHWNSESAISSSDSGNEYSHMDMFSGFRTPSSAQSAASSLPTTPNSLDLTFGTKIEKPEPRSLMINTNLAQPRIYDANPSMASYSTSTSIMHTAIEFDPFSSMFYLNSPISPGKVVMMPESALTAVAEDKEMISPSVWTPSSATQMSSPSIYSNSSASSSIAGEDLQFVRSRTPSPEPDFLWNSFPTQVPSLLPQQCQLSSSVSIAMTNPSPPSRPPKSILSLRNRPDTPTTTSNPPSPGIPHTKPKALTRFAIKFFPRTSSPSPPSTPPTSSFSNGRASVEPSYSPFTRRQTPSPTPESPAWHPSPVAATSPTATTPKDAALRSPRHWFLPGRFRVSAGGMN